MSQVSLAVASAPREGTTPRPIDGTVVAVGDVARRLRDSIGLRSTRLDLPYGRVGCSPLVLIIAGTRIRREHALELVSMLTSAGFDRTARLLVRAITNGEEFVALTPDDRECILGVLDDPPIALSELRGALFGELNWQRSVGRPRYRR